MSQAGVSHTAQPACWSNVARTTRRCTPATKRTHSAPVSRNPSPRSSTREPPTAGPRAGDSDATDSRAAIDSESEPSPRVGGIRNTTAFSLSSYRAASVASKSSAIGGGGGSGACSASSPSDRSATPPSSSTSSCGSGSGCFNWGSAGGGGGGLYARRMRSSSEPKSSDWSAEILMIAPPSAEDQRQPAAGTSKTGCVRAEQPHLSATRALGCLGHPWRIRRSAVIRCGHHQQRRAVGRARTEPCAAGGGRVEESRCASRGRHRPEDEGCAPAGRPGRRRELEQRGFFVIDDVHSRRRSEGGAIEGERHSDLAGALDSEGGGATRQQPLGAAALCRPCLVLGVLALHQPVGACRQVSEAEQHLGRAEESRAAQLELPAPAKRRASGSHAGDAQWGEGQ
eukprot:scaffold14901_cov102-Isochrysis_galbana.AAC.2